MSLDLLQAAFLLRLCCDPLPPSVSKHWSNVGQQLGTQLPAKQ